MLRARPPARVAISPLINHNMHTFGRSYKVSLERYISGIKIGWIYIWIYIGIVYACAYVDPVLTSQSYDISIGTRRMNMSVLLLVMLMLMSPVFSLAYTCACAYAYALTKTRL